MNDMTDKLLDVAIQAARRAGEIHLSYQNKKLSDVTLKEGLDIRTEADLEAERAIIEAIHSSFPDHDILTEETELERKGSDYLWVVDPLDGTINFAAGLPLFSASIAVQKNGENIVGVINASAFGHLYIAQKGAGAYLGEKRLRVSESGLSASIVGMNLTAHFTDKHSDQALEIARNLAGRVRGLRVFVSGALELAYIAAGQMEGSLSIKSDPYSRMAGKLLVEEAGGRVTDEMGSPFTNQSTRIIASNGVIHEELAAVVRAAVDNA